MHAEKFEHEVIGTSKTFYRDQGLRVVIEGNKARTDGSTVYLPAIDQTKEVDLYQQRVMRGFIDHEAGHGRHTDKNAWTKAGVDPGRLQFAPQIVNAIEDVRIEKKIISEYPGSQKNLEATNEAVNRAVAEKFAKDPSALTDFRVVGALAVTWEGRRRMGYDVKSNEELLAQLPPDVREMAERVCDMGEKCENTTDVVQVGVSIDHELSEKPGGGGDGGEGGGEGGDVGGGKKSGGSRTSGGKMMSSELSDGVTNAIEAGDEDDRYRVWSWEQDHLWHIRGQHRDSLFTDWRDSALSTGLKKYERAKASVATEVSQMKRKLERALISKSNRGWLGNREEGNLDSRRLVKAFKGDPNVHRVREPAEDMDVVVGLVVDCSGSMSSGNRIGLARQAAICYAEALEKAAIPFVCAGFTNHYDDALNRGENAHTNKYRNYPLTMFVFKDFKETLKKAKPAMGAIVDVPMGDNNDGDSLMQFHRAFLRDRREKRRIMIVFSDGQPAASGGDVQKRLRDVVSYLEEEGIEMVAVGIQSEAPKKFYKRWVQVNDLKDLSKVALDQLAKLLISSKFKVDNRELMKVTEKIRR